MKKILLSPWLALLTLALVIGIRVTDPAFVESIRLRYFDTLITNIKGLKEVGVAAPSAKAQKDTVASIAASVNAITLAVNKMNEAKDKAHHAKSTSDASKSYCDKVKPYFDEIRKHADFLESVIDDNIWPMPKYREMLFIR